MAERVELILQLLSTSVAALFGAWIGAKLAFLRYRDERRFERRLEWLERAHRSAKLLYDALIPVIAAHEMNRPPAQDQLDAFTDRQADFAAVMATLPMYGSSALRQEIRPLTDRYAESVKAVPQLMHEGVPRSRMAALLTEQAKWLLDLLSVLSRHGREHLGFSD